MIGPIQREVSDALQYVSSTYVASEEDWIAFHTATGSDLNDHTFDDDALGALAITSEPGWRPWGTDWEDIRRMPDPWKTRMVHALTMMMDDPTTMPDDLRPTISSVSLADPRGKRSALHALASAAGLSLTKVANASSVSVSRVADYFGGKPLADPIVIAIEKGLESLGVVEKL